MKPETLFEIYDAVKQNDLKAKAKFLERLNSVLFRLSHSLFLAGVKPKYYQKELESKVFRFGMANQSILNLAHGNKGQILDKETRTVDIFSIYSILRMQIESFTIIFYLMFDEVTEDELNLRYSVYKLHGLKKQSEFEPNSEYGTTKLKEIENEVEELIRNIEASQFFKSATPKEQKSLVSPRFAKFISTETVMNNAGMDKIKLRDMWKIYSNHLHSEHIGDRQFNTMHRIEKSVDAPLSTVLTLSCILTAKLSHLIVDNFEAAKTELENLSGEDKTYLKIWSSLINRD
jgi:hypothetical protein